MANFDLSNLALKAACPTNEIILDDKEMPSIFVYIPEFRLCDVLSTADTSTHPAFRVDGQEIDGFYVGKYQTHHYNGRAYSLPGEDPSASLGLDAFVSYARAKGSGFHEITAIEWAAIALWCHKNGCEPKGNNNYGKDASESAYKAIPSMARDGSGRIQRVATGTGPVTWSHDGTLEGIWDMNGNVWEWCTGLRLVKAELQVLADNDAAADNANLAANSGAWKAIDAATGNLITPDGSGTTTGSVKLEWNGSKFVYDTTVTAANQGSHDCDFQNIECSANIGAAAKVLLQALAMMPDTGLTGTGIDTTYGGDHFWANTNETERCLYRGGGWGYGAQSGVFAASLGNPRSNVDTYFGGRSAYIG